MLFPQVQDAAAQGSHSGYTYTQRTCQELGQQPRQYQVRDPIPGSDWRSNGGWAIVLEMGSVRTAFGTRSWAAGSLPFAIELTSPVRREKRRLTDSNTGMTGFVTYLADGTPRTSVIIDRNNDGYIDAAGDKTAGPANNLWEFRPYATVYGAGYIRWANMLWCR